MSQSNLTHSDLLDMMSEFLAAVHGHYAQSASDLGGYELVEVPALGGYAVHTIGQNGCVGTAGLLQGCYQLDELYYALEAVVGVTAMLKREKRRAPRSRRAAAPREARHTLTDSSGGPFGRSVGAHALVP